MTFPKSVYFHLSQNLSSVHSWRICTLHRSHFSLMASHKSFHGKQKYWIIFSSFKHISSHFCLHQTMQ